MRDPRVVGRNRTGRVCISVRQPPRTIKLLIEKVEIMNAHLTDLPNRTAVGITGSLVQSHGLTAKIYCTYGKLETPSYS